MLFFVRRILFLVRVQALEKKTTGTKKRSVAKYDATKEKVYFDLMWIQNKAPTRGLRQTNPTLKFAGNGNKTR